MALLCAAPTLPAQDVLGARAGLIYSVEGKVCLNEEWLESLPGRYPLMPVHSELRTYEGSAQIVLAPGALLHVMEESRVRLLDNRVTQPHVELPAGTFRLKCSGRCGDGRVTVGLRDVLVEVTKRGEYLFDARLGRVTVIRGLAKVSSGTERREVRRGQVATTNDGIHVEDAFAVTALF